MVWQRILSGLVAAPVALLAAYLGGGFFVSVLLVAAVLAWLELQQMSRQTVRIYRPLGAVLLCLTILSGWINPNLILPMLAASLLILLSVQLLDYDETKWPAASFAVSTFFYLAVPLVHLLLLRTETGGWRCLSLVLLTTWAYDTFAFFAGKRFGRIRPWARISPKKSMEGLLGGLAGSVAIALVLLALLWPELSQLARCLYSVVFGLAAGLLAHLGDLAESAIKRTYQVKDSGHFLPGHGGLLDRVDSLLFVATFAYYFVTYLLL